MTAERPPDLPDFERPPVVEVGLGAQFEPLGDLTNRHIAEVWNEFREEFPEWVEQPIISPVFERFGLPRPLNQFSIDLRPAHAPNRALLLDASKTELIQLQSDRFHRNWRKVEVDGVYPRYERLRDRFQEDYRRVEQVLQKRLVPNQWEVLYLNHIPIGEGDFETQSEVLRQMGAQNSNNFLPQPESTQLAMHYVIEVDDRPVGRLHVTAVDGFRDQQRVLVLTLTARGVPASQDLEGVLRFLDLGREWIVRGFTSVTTPKAHSVWGRRDNGKL